MKFKVIFLKKKYIYYTIFFVIFVILLVVLLNLRGTYSTFNTVNDNKAIRTDLTGDGKDDILYINTSKDKYYIQVNSNDNSLYLKPDSSLNTVGKKYSYWPMKVTLMDVNRDKIPEIFVQASEDGSPVQHAFLYKNNEFKDILFNNNNIIGFLDCKNNKTPKVISGNLNESGITFTNYILVNDKFQNFKLNSASSFLGEDTAFSFVKYILNLSDSSKSTPKDIFYPGIEDSNIKNIDKLVAANCNYKFEDAVFMDTKWNNDGDASEVKWVINFMGTSKEDGAKITQYTLTLTMKSIVSSDNSYTFKINSIGLNN